MEENKEQQQPQVVATEENVADPQVDELAMQMEGMNVTHPLEVAIGFFCSFVHYVTNYQ